MREVRFYENTQDQAKLIVRSTSLTFRLIVQLTLYALALIRLADLRLSISLAA
jgi:hypothetical protein